MRLRYKIPVFGAVNENEYLLATFNISVGRKFGFAIYPKYLDLLIPSLFVLIN